MARHFDQEAIQRAAIIPKIAAHYSREELNAALAAARGAFLYSLEEAGAAVDRDRPFLRRSTQPSRFRNIAPDPKIGKSGNTCLMLRSRGRRKPQPRLSRSVSPRLLRRNRLCA